MNDNIKRKGFTLIELLSVIVILSILIVIAVPNIIKQVKVSKEKAFYISVSKIVENIKTDNIINNNDYCMYNYEDKNKENDFDKLYILVTKENNDLIYSVYASKNGIKTINVKDFSKINEKDTSNWDKDMSNNSAYSSVSKLYSNINLIEDNNYVVCDLKESRGDSND